VDGWLTVIRVPAVTPQVDGGGDIAQRLARFRLIWTGHTVERAQQVSRGPSQEALAVRAELVNHGPPHVPLYSLPGAPGYVTWRTAQRRPGDLDDRELL